MSLVHNAISEVSTWLAGELSNVPDHIKIVYVEWDFSYFKDEAFASMSTFGFEKLSETFDCSNPRDCYELGNFVWEGAKSLKLKESDYPGLDWTNVLREAAIVPVIRATVTRSSLRLLVGEHDDAVFDTT